MDFSRILHQVRQDPHLATYYQDTWRFTEYLASTSRMQFRFLGASYDGDNWTDVDKSVDYIHRFTVPYRKGMLSKFYQLEDWHNANPRAITLLSLTTYHDHYKNGKEARCEPSRGFTIPHSFDVLKSSWRNLSKCLAYYLPDVPWVWIMEPHLTGYPHLHTVVFQDLDRGTQEALKNLWSSKYQAGSLEHGIDFTSRKPGESIQSLRNYLVKYVAKGFTSTGSKFGEGDDWTPGQLVFYALTWKNRWRLFGASKELCDVMRYRRDTDESITWYATQLLDAHGELHNTWVAEGATPPPTSIEEVI